MLINQGRLIYRMDSAIKGTLTMQVPDGWKVEPLQTPFSFSSAGEKNNAAFAGSQFYRITLITNIA